MGESGPSVPSRTRAGDKRSRFDYEKVYLQIDVGKKRDLVGLERSRPAVALEETVWRGQSTRR